METHKNRKCQKQLYGTKDHNGQKEHISEPVISQYIKNIYYKDGFKTDGTED